MGGQTAPGAASWLQRHREALSFIALFGLCLLGFALFLQFRWVTLTLVNPYTERLARVAGFLLTLLGEETRVNGTLLTSSRPFVVNIYTGCNGVLATSIYVSAVLAFPAGWRARAIGVALGIPAIQVINMARILSLYYIGVFWPRLFRAAHGYVWQSIVIFLSMVVWIYWAERFARPRQAPAA